VGPTLSHTHHSFTFSLTLFTSLTLHSLTRHFHTLFGLMDTYYLTFEFKFFILPRQKKKKESHQHTHLPTTLIIIFLSINIIEHAKLTPRDSQRKHASTPFFHPHLHPHKLNIISPPLSLGGSGDKGKNILPSQPQLTEPTPPTHGQYNRNSFGS